MDDRMRVATELAGVMRDMSLSAARRVEAASCWRDLVRVAPVAADPWWKGHLKEHEALFWRLNYLLEAGDDPAPDCVDEAPDPRAVGLAVLLERSPTTRPPTRARASRPLVYAGLIPE
jgi:hypothetical protein